MAPGRVCCKPFRICEFSQKWPESGPVSPSSEHDLRFVSALGACQSAKNLARVGHALAVGFHRPQGVGRACFNGLFQNKQRADARCAQRPGHRRIVNVACAEGFGPDAALGLAQV